MPAAMSKPPTTPVPGNLLADAASPYLRQHADNPVHWRPWGEEAFAAARREGKPVLVSIGYSACHWCHVMAHESFADPEVAALLNRDFIAVKVDREEHPDVDHFYMTACQLLTGGGGWPLTVVATPEREPFFAGTYFPRESSPTRIGMLDLLPRLAAIWQEDHGKATTSAAQIVAAMRQVADRPSADRLPEGLPTLAVRQLAEMYDTEHGGFGPAPKFPVPHQLVFLLRHGRRHGDNQALAMATETLRRLRRGGIWDHLGFGFHRYATDRVWLVPHFEKMLYDQALHLLALAEAWQAVGDPEFARTAREVAAYVRRDLATPGGVFRTAEDADSEGEEGRFYVWTVAELRTALPPDQAAMAEQAFRTDPGGNWRVEASGQRNGTNILHLAPDAPLPDAASEGIRERLLARRSRRSRPGLDDKILADWNGLMIAALARAGTILGDDAMVAAAIAAARALNATLRTGPGRLLHCAPDIPGQLADHAHLAFAMLELHQATLDPAWLAEAIALHQALAADFADPGGGFFLTSATDPSLPLRLRDGHDGALPSGNAVAADNLLRLATLTGDPAWQRQAERTLRSLGESLRRSPASHAFALLALGRRNDDGGTVVVAGPPDAPATRALVAAARAAHPDALLLLRPDHGGDEATPPPICTLAPFTLAQRMVGGQPAAYLCRGQACQPPVTDPRGLA